MRYKKRHKSKTDKTTWIWVGLLSLLLVSLFSGIIWYKFVRDVKTFDKLTGCPKHNGIISPVAQSVIMIDLTDKLTDTQLQALRVKINNLVNEMENGTLLSFYTLTNNSIDSRKPIFEMCKIRDGYNANKFTENEKLLRKRFNQFFKIPLENIITGLSEIQDESNSSPIMEMLQSIAINSFEKWNIEGDKKLIIFSDMIHYTPEFSMYTKNLNFDNFYKTSYAQKRAIFIPNVEVQINYFINKPNYQTNQNVLFWKKYFQQANALLTQTTVIGQ